MKSLIAAALMAAAPLSVAWAAGQDWNTSFRHDAKSNSVGNPEARVKLTEFVSYTCPHCANYAKESDGLMRVGYINSGDVAVEVRPVIRNPVDLAATLVAQCGDPKKFFANHRALMRSQDTWLAKATGATEAQQQRWRAGPIPSRMRAIGGDLDFYEMMEPFGYSYAEIDQCLSNETRARQIVENSNADAADYGVRGTPSFAIDGELLEGVHNWPALQNALTDAGVRAGGENPANPVQKAPNQP